MGQISIEANKWDYEDDDVFVYISFYTALDSKNTL